jgi:gamma-glutamyltranspeptidase/glutathione hydrolase
VSNLVDYDLNIQEAIDFPRFHYVDRDQVAFEPEYDAELRQRLAAMGHAVVGEEAIMMRGGFGGGQGIMIDPATGCFWGGSDRRKDGCAAGW